MAKDARTFRDEAAAASAAGRHKKALECYLELERLEPRDAQWPKRAAETYRRLSKNAEAIAAYERAVERYVKSGFLVQAIAVCKVILQMQPDHSEALQRLAAINEQVGAGPTKVGSIIDRDTSLQENPVVAAALRGTGSFPLVSPSASASLPAASAEYAAEPPRFSAPPAPRPAPMETPLPPAMVAASSLPPTPPAPARPAPPVPARPAPIVPVPTSTQPGISPAVPAAPRPVSAALSPSATMIGVAVGEGRSSTASSPPGREARPGIAPPFAATPAGPAVYAPPRPPGASGAGPGEPASAAGPAMPFRAAPGSASAAASQVVPTRSRVDSVQVTPRRVRESSIPAMGARPRAAPITISPGAALDSVSLVEVVPGAHRQEGSSPGIMVIPIDDEYLSMDVAELPLEGAADVAAPAVELAPAGLDAAGATMASSPVIELALDGEDDDAPLAIEVDAADDGSDGDLAVVELAVDDVDEREPAVEPPDAFDPVHTIEAIELDALQEVDALDLATMSEIPLPAPRSMSTGATRALASTPLFAGLPSELLEALVHKLALVRLEPGEVLFREGEPGDALYVVVEGEVVVTGQEPTRGELSRLGAGDFFGEVALLTDQPRSATVAADGYAELLKIDRVTLSEVLADNGDLLRAVLRLVRDRMVDRWTRASGLFRPFGDDDRAGVVGRFRFLEIEPGSTMLRAGHRPDGLYIVLSGRAGVIRDGAEVAVLAAGDLVGETALLGGARLRADVVASTRVLALFLSASEFHELVLMYPHMLEYIGDQADQRAPVL